MSQEYRFEWPIRSTRALAYFINRTYDGLNIPNVRVCPHHSTPWQAFVDAYFSSTPVVVWKASRGFGGKSFLLSLLSDMEALTLNAEVNLLGGSGQQSKRVLDAIASLHQMKNYPKAKILDEQTHVTYYEGGAKLTALMASQASVRGPHPQRLNLDECLASGTQVLTSTGERAIDDLGVGDVVYSYAEGELNESRIRKIQFKGIRPTVRIEFSTGRAFYCTPEHPILTSDGWAQAETTLYQTVFVVRNAETFGCSRPIVHEMLSNVGSDCAGSVALPMWKPERCFLDWLRSLLRCSTGFAASLLQRLWRENCGTRTLHEMQVLLDERQRSSIANGGSACHGTGASPKPTRTSGSRTSDGSRRSILSPEAVGVSSVGFLRRTKRGDRSSWRLLARQGTEIDDGQGSNGKTRSCGDACRRVAAGPNAFLVEAARVVAVTPGPYLPVWDISVERDHTFVASGVVVHNCDEMDLDIFNASLGQPMSKGDAMAGITASSTHQNADGTMTEILRRASSRGWRIHQWCYKETMRSEANPFGWLESEEVERKRLVIPSAMWDAEYEGQEPNPEGRAIMTDAVDKMFDKDLGEIETPEGRYFEFELPDLAVGKYATGTDWARKVDRTIIATFRIDVKPARLVAFEALKRREWPYMIDRMVRRMKRYPGRASHDGTGIGDVIAGIIGSRAEPVILVGRERQEILTEYVKGVENGELKAPRLSLPYAEHRYASTDDLFKGGEDHHLPDTICAFALAYRAAFKRKSLAFASA